MGPQRLKSRLIDLIPPLTEETVTFYTKYRVLLRLGIELSHCTMLAVYPYLKFLHCSRNNKSMLINFFFYQRLMNRYACHAEMTLLANTGSKI